MSLLQIYNRELRRVGLTAVRLGKLGFRFLSMFTELRGRFRSCVLPIQQYSFCGRFRSCMLPNPNDQQSESRCMPSSALFPWFFRCPCPEVLLVLFLPFFAESVLSSARFFILFWICLERPTVLSGPAADRCLYSLDFLSSVPGS